MSAGDDRRSDLAVMDANEYKQKRRLRRILDAHDKVEDMGERAYGQYAEGVISHDGKNIRVLRAVQQYIREVYNLLMEYDKSLEEDEVNQYWVGHYLGELEREHSENIFFRGLKSVLYADEVYTEEWTESVEARHGPNQTVSKSATYTVPENVSVNAYLLVNQFLSQEKGLEIQFEEMDNQLPTWGFEEVEDYDPEKDPSIVDTEDTEVKADGD